MSNGFDLGSAAIGGLSGIVGGLLGANASSHAAGKQFKYNAWLQKQSAKLNLANSKAMAQYNYLLNNRSNFVNAKIQRQGLERAGLNPMLAVSNGVSSAGYNSGSVGGVGSAQTGLPDTGSALTQGISSGVANAQSFQRLANETKQADAISENQHSHAIKNEVEKQTMLKRLPYIEPKEKAEIGNIVSDTIKKEAEINNIDETTRFIEKNYELQKALGFAGIDASRYGSLMNYKGQVYNANTLSDIAAKHQPSGSSASFGNYTAGVRNIMSGIGDILHGRNDNYEHYDESTSRTVKDKNETYTKTSRRKGKRKK